MTPRWAPLAALVLAAAEIAVFVGLGNAIGYGLTLLLVVVASGVGVFLVRREGLRAWRGFRDATRVGAPPGPRVTDGVVGLTGAVLLAAPGLVTGVAGVALLLPPVRRRLRARVQARAERQMSSAQAGEVFGPRRVRVEQDGSLPGDADPGTDTDVVEGEIMDDR